MGRTSVVVFDVNETLSDMAPLARRFADVGAPELAASVWFASLLRDGFALTVAGSFEPFAALADDTLRIVLAGVPINRTIDAAVRHVMDGLLALDVHPDVPDGIRALRSAGPRLVTLSNGSADVAKRLLTKAGLRGEFELLLSVDDPRVWKPATRAYQYAANACAVVIEEMLLVAVHPWDIDGAARAGMRTAWINRSGSPFPPYFTKPHHTVTTLIELAERL